MAFLEGSRRGPSFRERRQTRCEDNRPCPQTREEEHLASAKKDISKESFNMSWILYFQICLVDPSKRPCNNHSTSFNDTEYNQRPSKKLALTIKAWLQRGMLPGTSLPIVFVYDKCPRLLSSFELFGDFRNRPCGIGVGVEGHVNVTPFIVHSL